MPLSGPPSGGQAFGQRGECESGLPHSLQNFLLPPKLQKFAGKSRCMKRIGKKLLWLLVILVVMVNVITICHAYKFTHFYESGEVSVKPASEKNGWDKTKEALFGINFTKRPNNYLPDSAFETVTLVTQDSLRLEAWYIPTTGTARGTVALFHGHGGNKSVMAAEAEAFRRMGFHTLMLDFRAHGGSGGNTCTIGAEEAEDVKLAYDHLVGRGETNIILWGISLGAATVTRAIHQYGLQPAKVILEMPFASLQDAVEGRVKMMGLPTQPLATLLTFWGGTIHGFWAFDHKPFEYAKSIRCPVLLQWGAKDPRVKRSETQAIYSNLAGPKKWVVYEESGHESLYKKETGRWLGAVTEFLQK
jgi:uncharacterized protein